MTRSFWTYILTTFLFFFQLASYSWNAVGHMVIADIAYQNVKPATRNKIDQLAAYFQNEYEEINSFIQMAAWPDYLHSQKIESFSHWHYIDMPFSKENRALPNLVKDDNAIWAFTNTLAVVQYKKANPYERARFLAFFAHIVGDLHQPLHTVSYVSDAHPKGDKGGNLYFIRYQGTPKRLHQLWDSGIDLLKGGVSEDNISFLAQSISELYPESYFGERAYELCPRIWLKEGMELSKNWVYRVPENQPVDAAYLAQSTQISKQQIALAGYRLAALLNRIFENHEFLASKRHRFSKEARRYQIIGLN